MKVGVVALQGDFERHLDRVEAVGAKGVEVRLPRDLEGVERLILPGGESSVFAKLARFTELDDAIRNAAGEGLPIWGTCMGMIVMARAIEHRPDQPTLGILDVDVRRNAFGAQVDSFEEPVALADGTVVTGVFIRAPIVTRIGEGVETLATHRGHVVAVRQGALVGTAFHPELTDDDRFLRSFLR